MAILTRKTKKYMIKLTSMRNQVQYNTEYKNTCNNRHDNFLGAMRFIATTMFTFATTITRHQIPREQQHCPRNNK